MSDEWFTFQRWEYGAPTEYFQSPELTRLFFEKADIKISAAWCFSRVDRRLIYFWGDTERHKIQQQTIGNMTYCFSRFGPFFEQLKENSSMLLSNALFDTSRGGSVKFVTSKVLGSGDQVEIYAGSDHLYIYLLRSRINDACGDINLRTYLQNRSERGFEVARLARPFFERIPKQILNINQDASTLIKQFFGPTRFGAARDSTDCFAWPWQRCLEQRDGSMQPKEIPTVSLVMDLRNSSSAMLLTRDASKFSGFIDSVVDDARRIITANGGYFDKDTGDGIVAHFEGPDNWDDGKSILENVLLAAREISRSTSRHCHEYQDHLQYRLQGLGCSVGIFASKAVWIYSWSGIRSVGHSIVNASRICSNAGPGEIGYCNQIERAIRSHKSVAEILPQAGVARAINVSEVRPTALPEATFVQVT